MRARRVVCTAGRKIGQKIAKNRLTNDLGKVIILISATQVKGRRGIRITVKQDKGVPNVWYDVWGVF